MLARGEGATGNAVDKDFNPGGTVMRAKPHVVCRPLIAKGRLNRRVNPERITREGSLQLLQCAAPFVAAVRHRHQIGNEKMAFAIG